MGGLQAACQCSAPPGAPASFLPAEVEGICTTVVSSNRSAVRLQPLQSTSLQSSGQGVGSLQPKANPHVCLEKAPRHVGAFPSLRWGRVGAAACVLTHIPLPEPPPPPASHRTTSTLPNNTSALCSSCEGKRTTLSREEKTQSHQRLRVRLTLHLLPWRPQAPALKSSEG